MQDRIYEKKTYFLFLIHDKIKIRPFFCRKKDKPLKRGTINKDSCLFHKSFQKFVIMVVVLVSKGNYFVLICKLRNDILKNPDFNTSHTILCKDTQDLCTSFLSELVRFYRLKDFSMEDEIEINRVITTLQSLMRCKTNTSDKGERKE